VAATASGSASCPSWSPHVYICCVNVDLTIKTAVEHFRYPPPITMYSSLSPLCIHTFYIKLYLGLRIQEVLYLMVSVVNTHFFNMYSSPFSISHIILALLITRILQPLLLPLLLCISGTLSPQPVWLDSSCLCLTPAITLCG
jgi:hypothetical protein